MEMVLPDACPASWSAYALYTAIHVNVLLCRGYIGKGMNQNIRRRFRTHIWICTETVKASEVAKVEASVCSFLNTPKYTEIV